MGKIIYVDFGQKPAKTFNRVSPPARKEDEYISSVLHAIANRDISFLNTLDPRTDRGIRVFKKYSVEHRFLQAAYEDSVLSAKIILTAGYPHFDKNALTYWTFPGKTGAHFFTAAHLTRSRPMADLLLSHGVDFNKLSNLGIHPFTMIAKNTSNPGMHAFLKEHKYDPDNTLLSARFPDLGL